MTRKARDPFVNGSGTTISEKTALYTRKCLSCLKPFQPKSSKQRFCEDRCRLLAWAVEALAVALREGKAEGLRLRIQELFGDRLTVEVVHTDLDGRRPS